MTLSVDWRKALDLCGIDVPSSLDEFNIICPLHDDNIPSMSINVEKGVWICHSGCGQGRLTSLLPKLTKLSLDIYDIKGYNWAGELLAEEVKEERINSEVTLPFTNTQIPQWIYERGFTEETAKNWGWRVSDTGSLVIPAYNRDNLLIGWICRQPAGRQPRYIYSKGLNKSLVLFGEHLVTETIDFVCVVEGSLDAIWLWEHGFPAVAILGSNMSEYQEQAIRTLLTREIVLCLDNDETGMKAKEKMQPQLEKYGVVSFINLGRHKDVQDVRDESELQVIIENRRMF